MSDTRAQDIIRESLSIVRHNVKKSSTIFSFHETIQSSLLNSQELKKFISDVLASFRSLDKDKELASTSALELQQSESIWIPRRYTKEMPKVSWFYKDYILISHMSRYFFDKNTDHQNSERCGKKDIIPYLMREINLDLQNIEKAKILNHLKYRKATTFIAKIINAQQLSTLSEKIRLDLGKKFSKRNYLYDWSIVRNQLQAMQSGEYTKEANQAILKGNLFYEVGRSLTCDRDFLQKVEQYLKIYPEREEQWYTSLEKDFVVFAHHDNSNTLKEEIKRRILNNISEEQDTIIVDGPTYSYCSR